MQNIPTNNDAPLVVIKCITYNHEPYIRQCLEGFVMQQTNFKFVAVVVDDASTDRNAEIIKEFEEKYPEIIKPVYLKENHYSQGKSKEPFFKVWEDQVKYIALCEGDDYWTDPLKLQKQVDFLEANEEYSGTFHKAKIIYQNKDREGYTFPQLSSSTFEFTDCIKGWFIPTASILYRKKPEILNMNNYIQNKTFVLSGDRLLVASISYYGKFYSFDEVMSIYRKHSGGMSATSHLITINRSNYNLFLEIRKYTKPRYYGELTSSVLWWNGHLALSYRKERKYFKYFISLIKCLVYVRSVNDIKAWMKNYVLNIDNE